MKARAALWPIASIGLCSLLPGCTGARPVPPPVVVGAILCPEPAAPVLPLVDGGGTFDAPAAWAVLMERDDVMRAYIKGLRRTVDCYAAQAGEAPHD